MPEQFAIFAGRGKRRRMIGPFASAADADRYANVTFHPETWLIVPIEAPAEGWREDPAARIAPAAREPISDPAAMLIAIPSGIVLRAGGRDFPLETTRGRWWLDLPCGGCVDVTTHLETPIPDHVPDTLARIVGFYLPNGPAWDAIDAQAGG